MAFAAAIFPLVSSFLLSPTAITTAHNHQCTLPTRPQSTQLLGVSSHQIDRRCSLRGLLLFGAVVVMRPSLAAAQEDAPPTTTARPTNVPPSSATTTRPYASLDALLPAARVKIIIDKSVDTASNLVSSSDSNKQASLLIQELQDLLLKPQNYTRSSTLAAIPKKPAKQYLDTYKKNMDRLDILEKPGGLLVQSGEIDTWKRLKRQERVRESNDEIRAAFNAYTSNLSFSGDSYRLNVPKEQRSRMIREDALPDVKNVIASDMGLRYLIRNDILTNMQDARAELQYQLGQKEDSVEFDATDLLEILQQAQASCNRWFSLIDETDVKNALQEAAREDKQDVQS